MTKERKEEIIKTFATHEGDTGSPKYKLHFLQKESTTLTMTTLTFTRRTTTQEEVFL